MSKVDTRVEAKIIFNRIKYGEIFDIVLNHMITLNLYGLTDNLNHIYVDLCESFFDILIKEVTYHNYVIMIGVNDYDRIILNCLDKAIYLKDRELYDIDLSDIDQLSELIQEPIIIFLQNFSNQIKNEIKTSLISHNTQLINIINASDLETRFKKLHQPLPKIHTFKVTSINPQLNSNHIPIPIPKMELNYQRVPILGIDHQFKHQSNFLDIQL